MIFENLLKEFKDARGNKVSLPKRLDEVDMSLDNITNQIPILNTEYVNFGEVSLPSDFKTLPFKIYKDGFFKFSHNATPENQYDWSEAIEIFISYKSNSSSSDGTSESKPISWARFAQNVYNGIYNKYDFIVNVMDDITEEMSTGAITRPVNILMRSKSPSGFSWFGRFKNPSNPNGVAETNNRYTTPWAIDEETGLYVTVQYKAYSAYDVINFKDNLEYGDMPSPYLTASTLEECISQKGTYFVASDNKTVYCNKKDNEDINNIVILTVPVLDKTMTINAKTNSIIMFENIGFTTEQFYFKGDNINNKFYFFNCKFYRGLQDAFAINHMYQAYLFNCIASYSSKDCFNYHATNINSLAVEINCTAYGAGKYKMMNGNTTKHSNNASTAHNGMNILRISPRYWDCEGPLLADVDNCYSINIAPNVGSVLDSTTGHKTSYYFSDYDSTYRPDSVNKYLIEAKAMKGFNEFGLVSECKNLYVGGLYGFNTVSGDYNLMNMWQPN